MAKQKPVEESEGPEPLQESYQLKLSEQEISQLEARVIGDYRNAIGDHSKRVSRWLEYYRAWRSMPDQPKVGDETVSNFRVPLIRWSVFGKLAKEVDNLFGDDAEIVAVAQGESDARKVKKISKYMTWRVFSSMKLLRPFIVFCLRKLLFGRSFAHTPWRRDTYCVKVNGVEKEIVSYEGPGFEPLWPDDVIVPAENAATLHDFSFFIRRYRATPQQLLEGEECGVYAGIKGNFEQILQYAQHGVVRDAEGEPIAMQADLADGVMMQNPISSGEYLTILEWHGKWRMLKPGQNDAAENDLKRREMEQSDIVVRIIFQLQKFCGAQDLRVLYPTRQNPRPFVESSMLDDGRYWAPGLPELLLDSEDELSTNHNIATTAGQFSIGPVIVYRPAAGFEPQTMQLQPNSTLPCDDPNGIKVVQMTANTEFASWKEQAVLAYVERLSGMSDLSLGRQSDRPNAPRTLGQTNTLISEGNVRITLDTKLLREDMSAIVTYFWELEYCFSPPQMFFRVTEEDADGLWPVKNGGSILDHQDRDGRFDFDIKFATSTESKEAKKALALQLYQICLTNPLFAGNLLALWEVTRMAFEALGEMNFAAIIAKPQAPDLPIDPKQEWAMIQEGQDEVNPHPLDNDELHLIRHRRDIMDAEKDSNGDKDALQKLIIHYGQQIEQLQQKKLVQALAEKAMDMVAQLAPTLPQQPGAGPGVPQSPQPQPQQPQAA